MLEKKSISKILGVTIAAIYVIMLIFGILCCQSAMLTAEAESVADTAHSGISQEQEDEYYRNMGYEPVRKLGDLFKKYGGEQLREIKGAVLLNDIDCATDTSWHEFVDDWQKTGYEAPYFYFEFNGMGHKILNGENLLNVKINSSDNSIAAKKTVLLDTVKGVKNLYLENIAVAEDPDNYLRNVHVRSVNNKNIVNNYGLSLSAPDVISNCSVEGTLEYDYDIRHMNAKYLGGLVSSGSDCIIENSYFYGKIVCDAKDSSVNIGGLVGNTYGVRLKNCFAYYGLDLKNGDEARAGLIAGMQNMKAWSSKEDSYVDCLYEYDAVYAGNNNSIKEIGVRFYSDDNSKVENCDIEEIKTVPAALLGDKDTVSELDFDKVWNLEENDNHPTLRTLAVTVADNTKTSNISEKYNFNYVDMYYNEGDKFELSCSIDQTLGCVYLEIDGKDSLEKLSEDKLTIEVNKNTFIAFQVGYRQSLQIIIKVDGNDLYNAPDSAQDCLKIESENAILSGYTLYALGDKIKMKLTVKDGYHLKNIDLPKEAVKIGKNEYEIPVGKVTADWRASYNATVEIEKDFPIVGVIGIVAGVAVLATIVLLIVISKKRKKNKSV